MRFQFKKRWIERLYLEGKTTKSIPPKVIEAFFEVVAIIEAAADRSGRTRPTCSEVPPLREAQGRTWTVGAKITAAGQAVSLRLLITLEQHEDGRIVYILDIIDDH